MRLIITASLPFWVSLTTPTQVQITTSEVV